MVMVRMLEGVYHITNDDADKSLVDGSASGGGGA